MEGSSKIYDAVIVGAGAAGISCTKELVERGYKNVVCLEALDEAGGRVKFNRKFGDLGGMCLHLPNRFSKIEDLDAEFWGAADLVQFAKENNFRFHREGNKPKFRLYKNGQKVKESLVNHANSLINNAINSITERINNKELPSDITLQDALADLLEDDICRTLINTIYSSTDTGLDASDISFNDYSNTMPSNPGLFPVDGMGPLLNAYSRPARPYILLSREVLSVQKLRTRYRLKMLDTTSGVAYEIETRSLVLTVSVGVLQSWIKDKKIVLPEEKIKAINSIRMGYLNKNILVMDELFFTENNITSFTHINIRSNHLDEDANFLAVNMHDKYAMINFVGGKKSLLYEKKGTAYARRESLQILASVFGNEVYDFCIGSYLSRWNRDKYFLGSYSAATKDNYHARLELSKPLDRNMYLAGEAVRYSSDDISYHTHISGALHSGFKAANLVIRQLESS